MPINLTGPTQMAIGAAAGHKLLTGQQKVNDTVAQLAQKDYDWTHRGGNENVNAVLSVLNDETFTPEEAQQILAEDLTPFERDLACRLNTSNKTISHLTGTLNSVSESMKIQSSRKKVKAIRVALKAGGIK